MITVNNIFAKLLLPTLMVCTVPTNCVRPWKNTKLWPPKQTTWKHKQVGYDCLHKMKWFKHPSPTNVLKHVQEQTKLGWPERDPNLENFIHKMLEKYENRYYCIIYRHWQLTPDDLWGDECTPKIAQEITESTRGHDPLFGKTENNIAALNQALTLLLQSSQ